MNCVRCEIVRAKLRTFLLFNLGYGADEIVFDLNVRYSGVYFWHFVYGQLHIRRKHDAAATESVLIAAFGEAEWKLNDVV